MTGFFQAPSLAIASEPSWPVDIARLVACLAAPDLTNRRLLPITAVASDADLDTDLGDVLTAPSGAVGQFLRARVSHRSKVDGGTRLNAPAMALFTLAPGARGSGTA